MGPKKSLLSGIRAGWVSGRSVLAELGKDVIEMLPSRRAGLRSESKRSPGAPGGAFRPGIRRFGEISLDSGSLMKKVRISPIPACRD